MCERKKPLENKRFDDGVIWQYVRGKNHLKTKVLMMVLFGSV
jgi:hypothetical protein